MKKLQPFLLALSLAAGGCSATRLLAAEPELDFKPLFNGKDLNGWDGNPKLWFVQDGAITGKTGTDADTAIKHNTFLVYTNGTVADFELRLTYRILGGNSGVQYRSKVLRTGPFGPVVGGYQADFEAGKTYSGILYEEQGRGILAQRGQKTVVKPDPADPKKHKIEVVGSLGKSEDIQAKIKHEDWNDYVVIAQGNHFQHFINVVQTVDVVDEHEAGAAKSGILALQIHVGPPMTVQFKNVRMKKLSGTATARSDFDKMQGDWVPIELVSSGKTSSTETMAAIKVKLKGNEYFVERADGQSQGTFKLNESTKSMDLTSQSGSDVPAIYEISGDTFKACYALRGAARPTEFKSTEGSDHVLVVYKRKAQ